MPEVGKLTNLQTLNLEGTKVTDAGMSEVDKLTNLQTLDLGCTKVTDAGLRVLKEAIPKLIIDR